MRPYSDFGDIFGSAKTYRLLAGSWDTSSPSLDLTMPPYLEALSLLILGIHNTCLLCLIYTKFHLHDRFQTPYPPTLLLIPSSV